MASKRRLKKAIHALCKELFEECCLISTLVISSDSEKSESVLTQIVNTEKGFVQRIGQCKGKKDRLGVKKHFSKLKEDWCNALCDIDENMNSITK